MTSTKDSGSNKIDRLPLKGCLITFRYNFWSKFFKIYFFTIWVKEAVAAGILKLGLTLTHIFGPMLYITIIELCFLS